MKMTGVVEKKVNWLLERDNVDKKQLVDKMAGRETKEEQASNIGLLLKTGIDVKVKNLSDQIAELQAQKKLLTNARDILRYDLHDRIVKMIGMNKTLTTNKDQKIRSSLTVEVGYGNIVDTDDIKSLPSDYWEMIPVLKKQVIKDAFKALKPADIKDMTESQILENMSQVVGEAFNGMIDVVIGNKVTIS